jgi:hypothetical protein
MTTATPLNDVPLPPGAQANEDDWAACDNQCRIIHGPTRTIAKDVFVHSTAVQLPDGSLEHNDGCGGEAPSVTISCDWSENLTVPQARQLAAAIVAAADEVDAWTAWAADLDEVTR